MSQHRSSKPRLRNSQHFGLEQLEQRLAMATTLSLVGPGSPVYEGDRANFTLTLSEAPRFPERVMVTTAPRTATYGSDYFAPPATQILFSPGQTSRTFSISTLRDAGSDKAEGPETFQVIATPANAAIQVRTVTVSINDYLPPPLIRINDVQVNEGNSGTTAATFQITLSAPTNRSVTVAYATKDGSATAADSDYAPVNGALTFAPGEVSKTVSVNVAGDRKLETDETFSLVLTPSAYGVIQRGVGTATIRNDETDQPGFQITLKFTDPTLPDPTQAIFRRAASRWSQIIVGDLPSSEYGGQFVDDFLFEVTINPAMDPSLLGGATFYPASLRPGPTGLPLAGHGEFNGRYMTAPGIYYTVLHEMAHALGFNPDLWQRPGFGLASGFGAPGASDPRFLGVNATREYNSYFATTETSVPLDDIHPPGSYGAHWRESVFGASRELMTWSWGVQSTGVDPISKVTIGAMADIGYSVNYAAADPYTRPAAIVAVNVAAVAANSGNPGTALPKPIAKSPTAASQPIAAISILPLGQPAQPAPSKVILATVTAPRSKPPQTLTPPTSLVFSLLANG